MKWETGRQGTGYLKTKIFESKRLSMDCYLLKYPRESFIPPHVDPVGDKRHFRLNVELKKAVKGGVFHTDKYLLKLPRVTLFRPDESLHEVSRIESGERLVLSLGWARR